MESRVLKPMLAVYVVAFILFLYGLRHITATPFDRLDSSADSLMYVGAALIGSGLLELLRQGKK